MAVSTSHPDVRRLVEDPPATAVIVGQLTDPAVLVTVVLAVVSFDSSPPLLALGWTVLAALFCAGIPLAVLVSLVGRGIVLDRHVVIREQRRLPLLAALVSVVVGVATLGVLGAPQPVLALVLAMLAGLMTMTLLSTVYKASFHLAVAAGVAGVLGTICGWWVYPAAFVALAVVGWARMCTGRHTLGQVVIGAMVGWSAASLVFASLN